MGNLFIKRKVTHVWQSLLSCTKKHAFLLGAKDYYCPFNLIFLPAGFAELQLIIIHKISGFWHVHFLNCRVDFDFLTRDSYGLFNSLTMLPFCSIFSWEKWSPLNSLFQNMFVA